MVRENMCLLGCMFAVDRLIEKGSSSYAVKVNDKWETIPWNEVREWLNEQAVNPDRSVLDKIKVEIIELKRRKIKADLEWLKRHKGRVLTDDYNILIDSQKVLDILDKYKTEGKE